MSLVLVSLIFLAARQIAYGRPWLARLNLTDSVRIVLKPRTLLGIVTALLFVAAVRVLGLRCSASNHIGIGAGPAPASTTESLRPNRTTGSARSRVSRSASPAHRTSSHRWNTRSPNRSRPSLDFQSFRRNSTIGLVITLSASNPDRYPTSLAGRKVHETAFGDDPITTAEDDLLGREGLAEVLAAEISGLDARQGAVVAITGPWGSGKTSLMHLTAARLRQDHGILGVVEFNPWLFSGAEQLAENLLSELAIQLRDQETRKGAGALGPQSPPHRHRPGPGMITGRSCRSARRSPPA